MIKQLFFLGFLILSINGLSQSDTLTDSKVIQVVSKKGLQVRKIKDYQTATVFLKNQEEPIEGMLEIHNEDTLKIDSNLIPISDIELLKLQNKPATIVGGTVLGIGIATSALGATLLIVASTSSNTSTTIASAILGITAVSLGAPITAIGGTVLGTSIKKYKAEKWNIVVVDKDQN